MEQKRKKILYVITKSNMGGAQRYVYDLATRLPASDFEVVVAMGGTGPLRERLEAAPVRTIQVQHFTRDVSYLGDVRAFFELISLYRNERPDVVHLNSAKAVTLGALAARIARVPRIVATVHGWASHEPRPWWQRILIRAIEWVGVILAHQTIVVSAHDARRGTTTIHNGIDAPDFLSREEARRALGLPQDTYVIGTIGELTRNKNHKLLIEAVGILPRENITLAIIGEGELRAPLEAAIANYPHHDMRLLGYRENAAQYLKAFDVFALPSLKEGLPYVLIEAGTADLPVVVSDVGGVAEIVIHAESGTLIREPSREGYAHAVEHYRTHAPEASMHANNLSVHIAKHFTLSRMVTDTRRHY